MKTPRQYYCTVCGGLFNQTGEGGLRVTCPEHEKMHKNNKVRESMARMSARRAKESGRLDQLKRNLEEKKIQVQKLEERIHRIEELAK